MLKNKNYFLTSLQMYHVYNSHSFINNNHLLNTTVKIIVLNLLHVTSQHFTHSVDGLKHVSLYCVSQEIRANTLHDEVRVQTPSSVLTFHPVSDKVSLLFDANQPEHRFSF